MNSRIQLCLSNLATFVPQSFRGQKGRERDWERVCERQIKRGREWVFGEGRASLILFDLELIKRRCCWSWCAAVHILFSLLAQVHHHVNYCQLISVVPTSLVQHFIIHRTIWFSFAFNSNKVNTESHNYKHSAIVNPPSWNLFQLAGVNFILLLKRHSIYMQIKFQFVSVEITLIVFMHKQIWCAHSKADSERRGLRQAWRTVANSRLYNIHNDLYTQSAQWVQTTVHISMFWYKELSSIH